MILVEIGGFLGADAEERYTASGKRVIALRVAARIRQGRRDDRNGVQGDRGRDDDTVWWRVNIWSDRFDKMLPYLKKGSAVIVIGEMNRPETYVTKDGTTQVSLTMTAEILKFSPFGKPDRPGMEGQQMGMQSPSAQEEYAGYGAGLKEFGGDSGTDDDLPF